MVNIDWGKQSYKLRLQQNTSHVANSRYLFVVLSNRIAVFSKHPEVLYFARNANAKGMHYTPVGGYWRCSHHPSSLWQTKVSLASTRGRWNPSQTCLSGCGAGSELCYRAPSHCSAPWWPTGCWCPVRGAPTYPSISPGANEMSRLKVKVVAIMQVSRVRRNNIFSYGCFLQEALLCLIYIKSWQDTCAAPVGGKLILKITT